MELGWWEHLIQGIDLRTKQFTQRVTPCNLVLFIKRFAKQVSSLVVSHQVPLPLQLQVLLKFSISLVVFTTTPLCPRWKFSVV